MGTIVRFHLSLSFLTDKKKKNQTSSYLAISWVSAVLCYSNSCINPVVAGTTWAAAEQHCQDLRWF